MIFTPPCDTAKFAPHAPFLLYLYPILHLFLPFWLNFALVFCLFSIFFHIFLFFFPMWIFFPNMTSANPGGGGIFLFIRPWLLDNNCIFYFHFFLHNIFRNSLLHILAPLSSTGPRVLNVIPVLTFMKSSKFSEVVSLYFPAIDIFGYILYA